MRHPTVFRCLPLAVAAAAFVLTASAWPGRAAGIPFSEATVTRLQNRVTYGVGVDNTRPAVARDVVRAGNYLLTESDARAELQYPDGTIARLGQNTIFSFEADSRTLELKKGTFIFYVPKGQGASLIKTPSLTAAITGTVGKVSHDMIAILDGAVKLIPSGRIVHAGEFARRNADGSITIGFFDTKAPEGALMTFNGPLPPFKEKLLTAGLTPDLSQIATQESLERTTIEQAALVHFFPTPTPTPPPTVTSSPPTPPPVITTPLQVTTPRSIRTSTPFGNQAGGAETGFGRVLPSQKGGR